MLHHPPKLDYKGLTIIMSQGSRFDVSQLLSGNAGSWFCNEVMRPAMNRFQCDIYDLEEFIKIGRRLREGTKCVLLFGQKAQQSILQVDTTIGEQRGSPIVRDGIAYISSFTPQDCFDPIDFETRLNPALNGTSNFDDGLTVTDGEAEADGDDDQLGKSRHGRTSRANFRFWLEKDTRKAIRICKEGWVETSEPEYKIYPSSSEVIEVLNSYENTDLFLDIETDIELNITCFGFSFGESSPVYVVPLIRYNYTLAYSNVGAILRALLRAIQRNCTIAHNGAGFDFFVLAYIYRLPIGKVVYDTMIAMHRCFPEVEKSLGHCISLFTNLPYHKDEGILNPQNERQEESLWKYNGKDVFAMREVKKEIEAYSKTVKGLPESIRQACSSIRPYLTTTLQGIRFRQDKVTSILTNNDRKLTLILRLIEAALGKDLTREVKGTSKKGLPGSNTQCVRYFHDVCGYPVVGRSKKTRKPSLDEKNMLKLALKAQNPVIDLVLLYRGIAKESGSLKFLPWDGLKKY